MEALKQIIADQIQSIVTFYNPYLDKLSDNEKMDLKDLDTCLQILEKNSEKVG